MMLLFTKNKFIIKKQLEIYKLFYDKNGHKVLGKNTIINIQKTHFRVSKKYNKNCKNNNIVYHIKAGELYDAIESKLYSQNLLNILLGKAEVTSNDDKNIFIICIIGCVVVVSIKALVKFC